MTNKDDKYVKEIVTDYDALSIRCDEAEVNKQNRELQDVIIKLKHTIRANEGMLGLSANQIGAYKRVCCLNFNNDIKTFINPLITKVEGFELSKEKCHSIPNKEYIRPRHSKITVTYQTPLGKIETVELLGLAAKVMQHHIDHLDGLLLNDVGLPVDEEFNNATEAEQQEVINYYLESLEIAKDKIDTDISKDEEANKIFKSAEFIKSVNSGKTKIENVPWTEEQIEMYKEAKKQLKRVK